MHFTTTLRQLRDDLEARCNEASAILKQFPRGPLGLTPDHVKRNPVWREAKREYQAAFNRLRAFNAKYAKVLRNGEGR